MTRPRENGIAVIGMGVRFPKAKTVEEFWNNLHRGIETISFFSDEELLEAGVDSDLLNNSNYVKARGVLEGSDLFDASFFGYSPREAELTDPQQRLFLEVAWEAFENAGYYPEKYEGLIGVYAGVGATSYLIQNLASNPQLIEPENAFQTFLGNEKDFLATRVSYKLNLRGPSLNIQTACSTSLVAVHLACRSLINYECDMALAGGATVRSSQISGYLYREGGIRSPDGHCRAFDAGAGGTVDGSGVGAVVLKRLEDALHDGDYIYAVIKGSAINNDGASKVGYTAPSVDGQAEVIMEALSDAGVEPETIGYVEAHGTATALGDPIEIAALTQAFRAGTSKKGFCAVGSVKTNMGHLDTAAGIAGLIKAILALKNRVIPPSLHFERPHPNIDFAESPFYVNSTPILWNRGESPLRAGVSSFGIGGTNAHLVVEEAPDHEQSGTSRPWQLLSISAKTASALETASENLSDHLKRDGNLNLADAAFTLQLGRKPFEHRRIVVGCDSASVGRALEEQDPTCVFTGVQDGERRPVIFMFPGQGSQYPGMGRELYLTEPTFRDQVDGCSNILGPYLGRDLREILFPRDEEADKSERLLRETYITQPAVFVIEYALAKLWLKWGIRPQAMIGHSLGEYVAACLAGVFTLEEALKLVAVRGRLMQSLPRGAMTTVTLDEGEIRPFLSERLSLAAVNAPNSCVVSGPEDDITELASRLDRRGIVFRRLETSHAFHSPIMDSMRTLFAGEIGKVALKPPTIAYVSNLTGTWITPQEATDPEYWLQQLRQPVRFSDGVGELLKDQRAVFLEVGPGQGLSGLVNRLASKTDERVVLSSIQHRHGRDSDVRFLLKSLGRLWLAGAEIDWPAVYEGRRRRVPAPTYPFERQRYRIEPQKQTEGNLFKPIIEKRADLADWFYTISWKRSAPLAVPMTSGGDKWLLFGAGSESEKQLIGKLRQAGDHVVTVVTGENFSHFADDAFVINPRRREDYDLLIRELQRQNKIPTRVLHLWNVTRSSDPPRVGEDWAIDLAFYSPLFFFQALSGHGVATPIRMVMVSNGVQEVTGEETLCPEKALLLGPCAVVEQEYPNITCLSIDLTLERETGDLNEKLVGRLIAEGSLETSDRVIAYRGNHRWVRAFEQTRLASPLDFRERLRPGGVYLITGGCGGIGLTIAETLASQVKARLILVGRTQFPEREQWESWATKHPDDNFLSRKIQKLLALEEKGAEVAVFSADVTSREQLLGVLTEAGRRFGKINGVIHAAGLPGSGIIHLLRPETAGKALRPKVIGARILESVFEGQELDFFVLFSSLNSITGGLGQADYCAANAFLNAFASDYAARRGTFTVAINWGRWGEVGMAAEAGDEIGTTRSDQAPFVNQLDRLDHPLLEYLADQSTERITFLTELNASRHWIINEHRLMGRALAPGTAYLEMVRAGAERLTAGGPIEIRDTVFLTPLWVDAGGKTVRTTIEKNGDGYDFIISSDSRNQGSLGWTDHAMGRIVYQPTVQTKKYDLRELRERCRVKEIVIKDGERAKGLGPRWAAIKQIYIGETERLARIELPDSFSADLDVYKLHPALLDAATGFAKQYEGGFYLPLSYKKVRLFRPLTKKLYSYARRKEKSSSRKETLEFDITIMDERGEELLEIEEFTVKRADELSTKIKASSERSKAEVISPEEGCEAFNRIINNANSPAQIIVSPLDFSIVRQRSEKLRSASAVRHRTDSQTVGSEYSRPPLRTVFELPGAGTERIIAEVWQEILGIHEVGRDDNFFELGGDSVQAIRIMAKLNSSGLSLTAQQLFQYQTIAELAKVARGAESAHSNWSDRPAPLTPAQLSAIDMNPVEPDGIVSIILTETSAEIDSALWEKSLEYLSTYHRALSLRFEKHGSSWVMREPDSPGSITFERMDLSRLSESEQEAEVEAKISELKAGMSLSAGRLVRTAWFNLGEARRTRIIIIINCLVCDSVSLKIFLEDLQAVYRKLSQGEDPHLKPQTLSFKQWAERLSESERRSGPRSEPVSEAPEFFPGMARLSKDEVRDLKPESEPRTLSISLSVAETESLNGEAAAVYNMRPDEILLTALVRTYSHESGSRSVLIDRLLHGRRDIFDDAEVSRTVGCFNHAITKRYQIDDLDDLGGSLVTIKEQCRSNVNEGLNDIRRLSSNNEGAAESNPQMFLQPRIAFNYLGQFDQIISDSDLLGSVLKLEMGGYGRPGPVRQFIEVKSRINERRLQVEWVYGETQIETTSVERLVLEFERQLRMLLTHCQTQESTIFTPSDFPLADLDNRTLQTLSRLIAQSDTFLSQG